MSTLPRLPAKAAYLHLNNPSRRNALSLSVLRDLRDQLYKYTTSPSDQRPRLLPPFRPQLLPQLERLASTSIPSTTDPTPTTDYSWLVNTSQWAQHRGNLPSVLVLAASGPVFSAGHDLRELAKLPRDEVKETFAICAEVMKLIRRFPGIVVGRIQGLATAAGLQLALATDVPVALSGTDVRLPGGTIALPCTSPSTSVRSRVGDAMAWRMLSTARGHKVDELGGAVDVVDPGEGDGEGKLDERVLELVEGLCTQSGMASALGKWAFWAMKELKGEETWLKSKDLVYEVDAMEGRDSHEERVEWAGRMMALHASMDDAREGMTAFMEKRKPVWNT